MTAEEMMDEDAEDTYVQFLTYYYLENGTLPYDIEMRGDDRAIDIGEPNLWIHRQIDPQPRYSSRSWADEEDLNLCQIVT